MFLFVQPLISIVSAQDNEMEAIKIDVELQEDGSATVTEKRKMQMHEDTELYIEMINLEGSDLLGFEVLGFTEEPDWDIDASFEEKANKYGVLEVEDGYELAWGISEYGEQEYTVKYSLSNLVRELEDGQSLFWNFDTFLSHPTEEFEINISAPFDIGEEVQEFYGFGFEGPYSITDGIFHWSGNNLDVDNNIIALLQFPPGVFDLDLKEDMSLAEQKERALEGSSYNEEVSEPMPTALKIFITVASLIPVGLGGGAIAYAVTKKNIQKENNDFMPREAVKKNNNKYSKTPPHLDGNLEDFSYLISQLSMRGGGFSEYFVAYLLIWSTEEKITIQTKEEKQFIGTKTRGRILIKDFESYQFDDLTFDEYVELYEVGEATLEEVIWGMLLEIATADGIVDNREIELWSEDYAEEVIELAKLLEEHSLDWLEDNGYFNNYSLKHWKTTIDIHQPTEKGEKVITDLIQFETFIKNIKKIEIEDYDNWRELIIWATIFGYAEDTVEFLEEFKPDTWLYLESNYPYLYGGYYGYQTFYTSSTTGLMSSGYSSGGVGGMSSGGGGAGAGGGGGGGSR